MHKYGAVDRHNQCVFVIMHAYKVPTVKIKRGGECEIVMYKDISDESDSFGVDNGANDNDKYMDNVSLHCGHLAFVASCLLVGSWCLLSR